MEAQREMHQNLKFMNKTSHFPSGFQSVSLIQRPIPCRHSLLPSSGPTLTDSANIDMCYIFFNIKYAPSIDYCTIRKMWVVSLSLSLSQSGSLFSDWYEMHTTENKLFVANNSQICKQSQKCWMRFECTAKKRVNLKSEHNPKTWLKRLKKLAFVKNILCPYTPISFSEYFRCIFVEIHAHSLTKHLCICVQVFDK